MKGTIKSLFQRIAKRFPLLKVKLRQAGMDQKPEDFIRKTCISSLYMTTGIVAILLFMFVRLRLFIGLLLMLAPIFFIVIFFYLIRLPDLKISQRDKDASREILFSGRFLIIEIESGVPLYNAMINVSNNYPSVGIYFREIINKIDLGTAMEDALNEGVEFCPSNDLRKILLQIMSSIRTGANVSKSLYTITEQIRKDQITEVNKYGKKLNPLAMFYMIIAVILPSLGMTMTIILSSFLQFELSLTILLAIAVFLGFIQFMFISMVKFSRPSFEY